MVAVGDSATVWVAIVGALQVVLLALIALLGQRSHRETVKLNGHAAKLLEERVRDELVQQ